MDGSKYRTRSTCAGHALYELSAQNKLVKIRMPGDSPILKLPDELLDMILTFHTSHGVPEGCRERDCGPEHDRRTLATLSLTCHRFRRIVFPFLNRTLYLEYPPLRTTVKRIREEARKQPYLLHSCRRLSIDVVLASRRIDASCNVMIKTVFSYLREVQCLELRGSYGPVGLQRLIFDVIQSTPKVKHLVIHDSPSNLNLVDALDRCDLPSLKSLDIRQSSRGHWLPRSLKECRIIPFTSLSLSYFTYDGKSLDQLLQRSNSLSHFHMRAIRVSETGPHLSVIQSTLLIHKDTLKTITIGLQSDKDNSYKDTSARGKECLFQASAFPNLEVFTLVGHLKDVRLEPSAAVANSLLGPNLKTFRWILRGDLHGPEAWGSFGDREQRFIRGLAKAALREIEIEFDPDPRLSSLKDGYPWDRMDVIREEIRPHGIELVYSKPPVTKERWLGRGSL